MVIKKTRVLQTADSDQTVVNRQDRMRLFSQDKSELERRIDEETARGWKLVSRSFSLDDGHGAEMVRPAAVETT
ncbi:MAG: hypothetical protein NT159_24785 [Proteobacteria bacterium]|nr:hypothetical protein [Pseudomonadota bacterium]